jgi:FtsH-binding integral membrane protein
MMFVFSSKITFFGLIIAQLALVFVLQAAAALHYWIGTRISVHDSLLINKVSLCKRITLLIAWFAANTPAVMMFVFSSKITFFGLIIAQLALVGRCGPALLNRNADICPWLSPD